MQLRKRLHIHRLLPRVVRPRMRNSVLQPLHKSHIGTCGDGLHPAHLHLLRQVPRRVTEREHHRTGLLLALLRGPLPRHTPQCAHRNLQRLALILAGILMRHGDGVRPAIESRSGLLAV